MVAELTDVSDFDALVEYWQCVQPLLRARGARVIAQSVGDGTRVEGDPAGPSTVRTVQVWPSREAFTAFWCSAAYAPLRRLRQQACRSVITLIPVTEH